MNTDKINKIATFDKFKVIKHTALIRLKIEEVIEDLKISGGNEFVLDYVFRQLKAAHKNVIMLEKLLQIRIGK